MSGRRPRPRVRDFFEDSLPADVGREPLVGVERQPDERGLADDVVFGHEAPEARVGRVVAVVAHHPVVVHIEGIGVGLFTVDVDAVFLDFQFVAFVSNDAAFVDGKVVLGQLDGGAFGRNPYRAVVVAVPFGVKVQRIHLSRELSRLDDNLADEFLVARKSCTSFW